LNWPFDPAIFHLSVPFIMHSSIQFFPPIRVVPCLLLWMSAQSLVAGGYDAPDAQQTAQRGLRPMLAGNLDRPLRYTPDGGDFVIVNGREFFNRSLYGGSSPFRADAGDNPEFSFYLPGHGGNLRLGFSTAKGIKWLHDAERVEARYRGGCMVYQIQDPLLAEGALRLVALVPKEGEGLLLKIESAPAGPPVEIHVAFGGISGVRGGRDGDIGCEKVPVRDFFRFAPGNCKDNEIHAEDGGFVVRSPFGSMVGLLPAGSMVRSANAGGWEDPAGLMTSPDAVADPRIAHGRFTLKPGAKAHLAIQHMPAKQSGGKSAEEVLQEYREVAAQDAAVKIDGHAIPWSKSDIPARFDREVKVLADVAGRVAIHTPDPFINAAMPALITAADGVWDDRIGAYLHGGVAWRTPLLGWRVAYAGDVFGWHERTRAHFDRYAAKQNASPIADRIPAPEENAYLARNETALHSNGDMTSSHYDMNMVGIDTIFRHLLWTGDLDYARKIWPVIERHLAWERRMFRRGFGPEKLPLYEAYACIWASDSLAYNGGGGTHSTAYNLYHNRMAARIARMLGHDPSPYEKEAELIGRGMKELLWLKDKGWFAEWKDLLGDQAAPQEAAAWSFYHTVDSEVPDPLDAWQMSRFVDTRLPHIPVRGPGVPDGYHTISTTTWMPWVWSLNNVVMGESAHTSHALWQAGRDDSAFKLFKGAILDSMYLGICPGNVGMCTWYDANRRESQRDFGDGVGALSRAFMEGLFGITPDLLAGELKIRPGFPSDWKEASIHHPSFDFLFDRKGETDRYQVVSRFAKPVDVRLTLATLRDDIASVTANGKALDWKLVKNAVGSPRIEILAPAAERQEIVVQWQGVPPAAGPGEVDVISGGTYAADAGAPILEIHDPQGALSDTSTDGSKLSGAVTGTLGHRTVFARVGQGKLSWWQPMAMNITEANPSKPIVFTTDWSKPLPGSVELDVIALDSLFNATVNGIFKQDYVTPRSPHVSLALPRHGFGSWCHPKDSSEVDDSGIRRAAAANNNLITLPNGVPLTTPGAADAKNIAFVSRWDNFPDEITVPLSGNALKIHLLMAGSTDGMKSRRDNGEIVVTYADGSRTRLALENPTTWWPIDQDYFIDDYAFRRPGPLPVRVDLKTGKIRVLDHKQFAGKGRRVAGGAATVLDIGLDPTREVKSLTVRAIANEVVIGLMSATLQRP
jgi:hypothetical protein